MLQKGMLLIIDDLLEEADSHVTKLFTKHSHHMEVSVIFITQNIFYKGLRTTTLNAHYLILFKSPRDAFQVAYLARQMYPGKTKFLTEAFQDATSKPFSYLAIDLRPETEDKLRVRTGIFPDEENYCYVTRI